MTQNVIAGPRQPRNRLLSKQTVSYNSFYSNIIHCEVCFYSLLGPVHNTPFVTVAFSMAILSITNLTICGVVVFVAFIAQNVSQ